MNKDIDALYDEAKEKANSILEKIIPIYESTFENEIMNVEPPINILVQQRVTVMHLAYLLFLMNDHKPPGEALDEILDETFDRAKESSKVLAKVYVRDQYDH